MPNLPPEPEFEQALKELTTTLAPFLKKHPEYQKALDIVQVAERVIQFRVVWEDDQGQAQVNRGYRVQFNSALGPYKGGLRLRDDVTLSILRFLALEQTFKNALTGLNMGGGKGGSDFDPKGKSDAEIRRFCKAFATELQRHISDVTDIPAGDIGFTGREVGYVFGQYKAIKNEWVGTITGKGVDWGGSHVRPEATGYGLVYYVEHMINHVEGDSSSGFKGKRVIVSGSGQVAQFAALKVIELGGTVLTLSDSKGCMVSKDGFTPEMIEKVFAIKTARQDLSTLGDEAGKLVFHAGARPWTLVDTYDVALPCATQNEVNGAEAAEIVKRGCRYIAEGSNMGCDLDAIKTFEDSRKSQGKSSACWYGPGKAANSGGVAVSGLEMAQNSSRLQWSAQEVDQKLKDIMLNCYTNCFTTGAKYPEDDDKFADQIPSLVVGANTAGFIKVADAMKAQGDWY